MDKSKSNTKSNRNGLRGHARCLGESEIKDRILAAWHRGDRSFDEVVEITGYTRAQVAYYLPVGIGRIK